MSENDKGMPVLSEESARPASQEKIIDDKPTMIDPGKTSSEIKTPKAPKVGIVVIAERAGFYNQQRIKKGLKFTIKGEKAFGGWFKCIDPVIEKKRLEYMKNKKGVS